MTWIYSGEQMERTTMEHVAYLYMEALRALIAHARSAEAFGYTPFDFPLANLGQQQLDRLIGTNRAVEYIYPMSPLQQGMLFHSLYAKTKGEYVVQMALTFEGDFDATEFEQPYVATERSVSAFQKALLTGATGFLGAFLLQDLLDQTDAEIYCLIRATDAEKGMQRIRENLERYELGAKKCKAASSLWSATLQSRCSG